MVSAAQFALRIPALLSRRGAHRLVYSRMLTRPAAFDWPRDVREGLAHDVRAPAEDLLRRTEFDPGPRWSRDRGPLNRPVEGHTSRLQPVSDAVARPRSTRTFSSLITSSIAQTGMARMGYGAALLRRRSAVLSVPSAADRPVRRRARFDCHWKISTQPVFADVLTFDEVAPRSIPVPALGEHARPSLQLMRFYWRASIRHAHRNAESLLWLFDVHLLAATLSDAEFERFTESRLRESVQPRARSGGHLEVRRSDPGDGPSRARRHSSPSRPRPIQPTGSGGTSSCSLRGLPRWRDRVRLLRESRSHGRVMREVGFEPDGSARAASRPLRSRWWLVAGRL